MVNLFRSWKGECTDSIVWWNVLKIADITVPGYQAFWADKHASLQSEYQVMIGQYPDADTQYRQLFKVLCAIEEMAGYVPAAVRESAEWMAVSAAEENRANYSEAVFRKTFFSALYGTHTVTLNELKAVLKASTSAGRTTTPKATEKPTQEEGFQEVRICRHQ